MINVILFGRRWDPSKNARPGSSLAELPGLSRGHLLGRSIGGRSLSWAHHRSPGHSAINNGADDDANGWLRQSCRSTRRPRREPTKPGPSTRWPGKNDASCFSRSWNAPSIDDNEIETTTRSKPRITICQPAPGTSTRWRRVVSEVNCCGWAMTLPENSIAELQNY